VGNAGLEKASKDKMRKNLNAMTERTLRIVSSELEEKSFGHKILSHLCIDSSAPDCSNGFIDP